MVNPEVTFRDPERVTFRMVLEVEASAFFSESVAEARERLTDRLLNRVTEYGRARGYRIELGVEWQELSVAPPIEEWVLLWDAKGGIQLGLRDEKVGLIHANGGFASSATHWCPIPRRPDGSTRLFPKESET